MPRKKRVVKKKSNKNLFAVLSAIILIALLTTVILVNWKKGNIIETPAKGQSESTNVEISSGDACTSNLQCFSASCRSAPSFVDCVNATSQETYYKNCENYTDVNVVRDFSRCACVQGICTAIR